MGHIKCRQCEYPAKPEYVRLPIVLIRCGDHQVWADGRAESRLRKWALSTGTDIDILRRFIKLPVELLVGEVIWPPKEPQ